MQDWRVIDRLCRLNAKTELWRGAPVMRRHFLARHGYRLNLSAPRTWNEKIQWRKIFDPNPLFPVVSDKVAMRAYARGKLDARDHWVLPDYHAVFGRAEDLQAEIFPEDAILKSTHACGWNLILRQTDARDMDMIRARVRRWLSRSYGATRRQNERFYWPITPRIAIEPLLTKPDGLLPEEVKFHLFDGEIRFVTYTDGARPTAHVGVLDEDWGLLPFSIHKPGLSSAPPKPPLWDDMCRIARRVGADFDHIRVDFLYTGDHLLLTEMAVAHVGGYGPVRPVEFDAEIGSWWTLPGQATP